MSPTIMWGQKPSSMIASAPPSTPISTGFVSRTYGRSIRRSFLWSTPRTTTSTGRSRSFVSNSGRSRLPETSSRSSRMWLIVFSANAGRHQILARDAVDLRVVDDRDVLGAEPLDEPLRPPAEPRGAVEALLLRSRPVRVRGRCLTAWGTVLEARDGHGGRPGGGDG